MSACTDASFLLWLIGLNKIDVQLCDLWISLSKLMINSTSIGMRIPMDNIASVMTLSFTSNLEENLLCPAESSKEPDRLV